MRSGSRAPAETRGAGRARGWGGGWRGRVKACIHRVPGAGVPARGLEASLRGDVGENTSPRGRRPGFESRSGPQCPHLQGPFLKGPSTGPVPIPSRPGPGQLGLTRGHGGRLTPSNRRAAWRRAGSAWAGARAGTPALTPMAYDPWLLRPRCSGWIRYGVPGEQHLVTAQFCSRGRKWLHFPMTQCSP